MQQQMNNDNTVMIYNIPEYIDQQNFISFLQVKKTSPQSIQFLPEINKSNSTKVCKMTFQAQQQVVQCLEALNKADLVGFKLKATKLENYQQRNPKANLYVSNIHPQLTSNQFYELFSRYGKIESAKLNKDANHPESAIGYVQFATEESAQKAIKEINGFDIEGLKINVCIKDKGKKEGNQAPNQPQQNGQQLLPGQFQQQNQRVPQQEEIKQAKPLKIAAPFIPTQQNQARFAFVLPNQAKFNDGFWQSQTVNLFMSENYGQNDPNYKDNLKVAMCVQEIIIEKRELLKKKKQTIKQLQKAQNSGLCLKDFEERKQLEDQLKAFQNKYNPFAIVNSDPELLNYQIDLHGGMRKKDAVELYFLNEQRIIAGLKNKAIGTNIDQKNHIIKIICGYGHHQNQQDPSRTGTLRNHFLQILKNSDKDFAYVENNGCFLVRVKI